MSCTNLMIHDLAVRVNERFSIEWCCSVQHLKHTHTEWPPITFWTIPSVSIFHGLQTRFKLLWTAPRDIMQHLTVNAQKFWTAPRDIMQIIMVNVLKFWTLVACQKSLDNQGRPRSDCFWRSSLIRVFPVCYSGRHFVNSSPENQHFMCQQKENSVQNFRTFTVLDLIWKQDDFW